MRARPRVLALLALHPLLAGACPAAPERTLTRSVQSTESEAERHVLELLNRDRVTAQLPPLPWDVRAAAIARADTRPS